MVVSFDENRENLMSQIKDDLICEIIRVSQTNLLGRKQHGAGDHEEEESILDWIKCNAANYRKSFMIHLDAFSATELGEILSKMTRSGEDLSQILEGCSWTSAQTKPLR
jgi:hypothetical protein